MSAQAYKNLQPLSWLSDPIPPSQHSRPAAQPVPSEWRYWIQSGGSRSRSGTPASELRSQVWRTDLWFGAGNPTESRDPGAETPKQPLGFAAMTGKTAPAAAKKAPASKKAPAPKKEPAHTPKEEPAHTPKEEPAHTPKEEPAHTPKEEHAPAPAAETPPAPEHHPDAEQPAAPAAEHAPAHEAEATPAHEEGSPPAAPAEAPAPEPEPEKPKEGEEGTGE